MATEPEISVREPLDHKAKAAIAEYAAIKAKATGLYAHVYMVEWVLQAERMPRAELYAWLAGQGYQWLPTAGFWTMEAK